MIWRAASETPYPALLPSSFAFAPLPLANLRTCFPLPVSPIIFLPPVQQQGQGCKLAGSCKDYIREQVYFHSPREVDISYCGEAQLPFIMYHGIRQFWLKVAIPRWLVTAKTQITFSIPFRGERVYFSLQFWVTVPYWGGHDGRNLGQQVTSHSQTGRGRTDACLYTSHFPFSIQSRTHAQGWVPLTLA